MWCEVAGATGAGLAAALAWLAVGDATAAHTSPSEAVQRGHLLVLTTPAQLRDGCDECFLEHSLFGWLRR